MDYIRRHAIDAITNTISITFDQLSELKSYAPCEKVNRLLGNLVALCSQIHEQDMVQEVG